jgi:hypothetical protein
VRGCCLCVGVARSLTSLARCRAFLPQSFRLPNLFSRYNVASGLDGVDSPSVASPAVPPPSVLTPVPPQATSNATATGSAEAAAAAAAAAAAEAERKRLSNVERFWAEEQARKGKPRVHIGVGGMSKAKKKQTYFQAPADTTHAKAMWEKMKTELDSKWEKFQGADGTEGGAEAGQREEKEEMTARASPSKSKQAGGYSNGPAQGARASAGGNGSATYRGGVENARENAAAAEAAAAAAQAAAQASRRSTAYAFTNIRKEDIKQDAKQYHYPYASAAGRDATAAYTNKAQPAQYQPHPPTGSSGGPTHQFSTGAKAAGAQYSSFSRPPQPHASGTGSTSAGTRDYFNTNSSSTQQQQQQQTSSTAYSSVPPTASSSSYPSAHAASSVHAGHTNSSTGASEKQQQALVDMFSRWSVKELKRELVTYGVSAIDLARLVEKDEYVLRCVRVHLEAETKAAQKQRAEAHAAEVRKQQQAKEQEKETLKDAIIHEVDRWAKGRNIKSMLNELNGATSLEQAGFLKRSDGLKEVSKAYKKALLRVHPDKHMDSDAKHLRATEVFKYVSQAFNEYRTKAEAAPAMPVHRSR